MVVSQHRTNVYIGLAGEGEFVGEGGLFRRADGSDEWEDISRGLPGNPQVRALLVRPDNPAVIFAGTHEGVYRSNDRGGHWEALDDGGQGNDVWSLAVHPSNPEVIFAGFEPCAISRSKDGGNTWGKMDTSRVEFPHITTCMEPVAKRVIGIAIDPVDPTNMYAAIEVGGLLASRDGGESWDQVSR